MIQFACFLVAVGMLFDTAIQREGGATIAPSVESDLKNPDGMRLAAVSVSVKEENLEDKIWNVVNF